MGKQYVSPKGKEGGGVGDIILNIILKSTT